MKTVTSDRRVINLKYKKHPLKRPTASVIAQGWDSLADSSRDEIQQLIEVLTAVKQGDFSVRLPYQKDGILGGAGELINDIIGLNEHMSGEFVRVGKIVGQEGRMTERASVGPAKGNWATSVNSVNQL